MARHLIRDGWQVRALTRDPRSLAPVFAGAYGVYSVQNSLLSGVDAGIRQGRNVAVTAQQASVQHLVFGFAGVGVKGTGVPSWESKLHIEEHMKRLRIPLTILRPVAFMELMTEKHFYPAMSTWHLMPNLMGGARQIPWLCVSDLGAIAARAFVQPERFVGRELRLAGDVRSIDECRSIYREVLGKDPPRLPMPLWIFERFGIVGKDLSTMWRWLRTASPDVAPDATRAIHAEVLGGRD